MREERANKEKNYRHKQPGREKIRKGSGKFPSGTGGGLTARKDGSAYRLPSHGGKPALEHVHWDLG